MTSATMRLAGSSIGTVPVGESKPKAPPTCHPMEIWNPWRTISYAPDPLDRVASIVKTALRVYVDSIRHECGRGRSCECGVPEDGDDGC